MKHLLLRLLAIAALTGCTAPEPSPKELIEQARELTFNCADYAAAMLAAGDALNAMPDSATAAEAYYIIAMCHSGAENHEAALAFHQKSLEMGGHYILDAANAAISAGQADLAMSILTEHRAADGDDNDVWLHALARAALASNRKAEALEALRRLYKTDFQGLNTEDRIVLAQDYLERGEQDSARIVTSTLNPGNSVGELLDYGLFLYDRGETPKAFEQMSKARDLSRRMPPRGNSEIYGRLYVIEHQRRLEQQQSSRRNTLLAAVSVIILLAAGAGTIYIQRTRARRKLLEMGNRLLLASNELKAEGEQQRTTINRLFRDSFNDIEMAANLLLDGAATRLVVRELNARVDSCRTPEFLSRLETAVDETHNEIMKRMKRDMHLSEADISVALFCAAGLSSRVVSLLLNCTPSALYNKKYRLKRKILEAPIADATRSEYLSILT